MIITLKKHNGLKPKQYETHCIVCGKKAENHFPSMSNKSSFTRWECPASFFEIRNFCLCDTCWNNWRDESSQYSIDGNISLGNVPHYRKIIHDITKTTGWRIK